MSYTHQWNHKGLYREFSGIITGEEILESNLKLQGDSRFDSLKYILNDFVPVSHFEINSDDIKRISAIDKAAALSNSKIKIANVVISELLMVTIKTYLDLMQSSGYKYKIFDNLEEAEYWCYE